MRSWFGGALYALTLSLLPATTEAQAVDRPGRFEVAAGGLWAGPVSMGSADATETTAGMARRSRYFPPRAPSRARSAWRRGLACALDKGLQLEGWFSHATPTRREAASDRIRKGFQTSRW